MRRSLVGLYGLTLATGLVVGQASLSGAALPTAPPAPTPAGATPAADRLTGSDEQVPPLEAKRRALTATALDAVIAGRATPQRIGGSTVVKVASGVAAPTVGNAAAGPALKGPAGGPSVTPQTATGTDGAVASQRGVGVGRDQYVRLSREGSDEILVVLAEFGNKRHPDYPDQDTYKGTPGPVKWTGPLHNQIPQPDRTVDNSTVWQPDYDVAHYQELYFGKGEESLKSYYERQSSNRYSVKGEVKGWVKVPYNEARYGRSTDLDGTDPVVCASVVCNNAPVLVTDSINALIKQYQDAGMTPDQIKAEFTKFDQQDRYDFDGDGNFDEPDGYIDHFQVVHAGGDESDGDPTYGEDALWAHRSYVGYGGIGTDGPPFNKLGGTPVGDTGLFIGDYTMQPENGGVSVYTHEYGHDLGLPDHYDTAGGDNGVEYWNLMAQSRLNGAGEPLGTRAGDLSAWDKLQLGWLDYETVRAGQTRSLDLGPHEYNSAKAQAVLDVLPPKTVTTKLGKPYSGTHQYFSGNADNLATSLTLPVDLTGKTGGVLATKARYDVETDYDYLYVQTSTDGGKNWTSRKGTVDGKPFGTDGSGNPAITGSTGGDWVDLSVPLTALDGKKGLVRMFYLTDGGVSAGGFFADDVRLGSDQGRLLFDDVEGKPKATLDGFSVVGASSTKDYANYYLASNRSWVSYDKYLKTGPYNFGFPDRPDFVEHFSYQQGLLVSYWDTSQPDNNTSQHPGQGLILPVDAHPEPLIRIDGGTWRSRVQVFDAPFSLIDAKSFDLHVNGQVQNIKGQPANPVFDDTQSYYRSIIPLTGVKVPHTGVSMTVTQQQGTSMTIKLGYNPPKG